MLTAFAILTDGLVYAAYLFLVAVGLSLNVTHGSFYAFGAYGAAVAVGIYFERGLPAAGGFLLMILVAMAIGLILGLVLERGLLRLVYGKDEIVVVLVTYAAFLILEDVIRLIWGAGSSPMLHAVPRATSTLTVAAAQSERRPVMAARTAMTASATSTATPSAADPDARVATK